MSDHPHSDIERQNNAGSPQSGEPVYVVVGKLRRPHGVMGEMSMSLMTDFPKRLKKGTELFVGKKRDRLLIRSIRFTEKGALIAFEDYLDCDVVGIFRNQYVYKKIEKNPDLPEGEFYHHEIIGMNVFSESGEALGIIDEIVETGANDVYVIRSGKKDEILIPAIKSVIMDIDRSTKRMIVRLPEWE